MKNQTSQLKTEGATVETAHLTCRSNANTADSNAKRQANRYRNPWFKSCGTPRPEFYENNAPKVREYRGVEIYKLFDHAYDFVLSGMCITQRAGITEYKKTIDEILDGRTPVDTVVCKHLRKLGHKPLSYAEYSANWQKIDGMNLEAA